MPTPPLLITRYLPPSILACHSVNIASECFKPSPVKRGILLGRDAEHAGNAKDGRDADEASDAGDAGLILEVLNVRRILKILATQAEPEMLRS